MTDLISSQLDGLLSVELAGWEDAWRTELRAPDGEWTRAGLAALRSMSPAEKRAYTKTGALPGRFGAGGPSAAPNPPPVPGKPLSGMDLWMSGEGVTPDVTPQETKAARGVWYSNTFSYTNDYLRKGTKPSVSAKNAIKALHGGYGAAKLRLPNTADNDDDYISQIGTLKGMIQRAAPFSRSAVMYRDVSAPDKVFGPVGSMKGRVFSDPGFMSATAEASSAERYGGVDEAGNTIDGDKITMNIPAGGGGMRSQPGFSPDHAREKEFTFAPGTRWRVDEDKIVNGKRQTTVTQIIPPGAKPSPPPAPIVPRIRDTSFIDRFGAGHRINVETGEYLS